MTASDPETALVPDQSPDATHALAFVLDHVSVEDWPSRIVVGDAEMLTAGKGTREAQICRTAGAVNGGVNGCVPPATACVALITPVDVFIHS